MLTMALATGTHLPQTGQSLRGNEAKPKAKIRQRCTEGTSYAEHMLETKDREVRRSLNDLSASRYHLAYAYSGLGDLCGRRLRRAKNERGARQWDRQRSVAFSHNWSSGYC